MKPSQSILVVSVFAAVLMLSRLPFLDNGYGMDPDIYRVLKAAEHIHETGEYKESRLPGFPMHEFMVAYSPALNSPVFSNTISAAASVAAVLFLGLIIQRFDPTHAQLLALSFGFCPVVYVNSTNSMDYLPAVALMLASIDLQLRRKFVWAGILLGLAVGFRLTSAALLLVCVPLYMGFKPLRIQMREFSIFALATLMIGLLCFLSVLKLHGLDFWFFYDYSELPGLEHYKFTGLELVWGTVWPVLFGLFAAAIGFVSFKSDDRIRLAGMSALGIVIYTIAFLRLPAEAGYLIPLIPFAIILLAMSRNSWLKWAFALILCISPFFEPFNKGNHNGYVLRDQQERKERTAYNETAIRFMESSEDPILLIAGWKEPQLKWQYEQSADDRHEVVYLVGSTDSISILQKAGYRIAYLPGMDAYIRSNFGYELDEVGGAELQPAD